MKYELYLDVVGLQIKSSVEELERIRIIFCFDVNLQRKKKGVEILLRDMTSNVT